MSASSLDGQLFCDQPLALLRGVVQLLLFAFPLAFSPVSGGTWTGKGFCVFSPLLQHRLDFSSCTTPPLSSSGAQCLKAARCTDSMSTSVGFHRHPPQWIMRIAVWRRCSSRQQRPPLGMQATVKCWSLLFPFTGCSF